VRQPLEESGAVATEMLFGQIARPDRSRQHTSLKLTLVERDTT
jgi:DNA-binding LacI/PurR family transcriptional regulator